MRLKHLPLIGLLLFIISVVVIPGAFATWKYSTTGPRQQDTNLSLGIVDFYYPPEEVLPGDDQATELHENHFNMVTSIVNHVDYGLNATKKPIIRELLEDGAGVVYSNQNVQGGNLKFVGDDISGLMFAVAYQTATEYIAYTFSDDYVTTANVGNYITVYKTIIVKGDNGRWVATTSFEGQAKVFSPQIADGPNIDVTSWRKI